MAKHLICIECPKSCRLDVEEENGAVRQVTGFQCPKGEAYARQEIEDPRRTLTTTVLAKGLELKLVPVRTSKPIPKTKLREAMAVCRKLVLTRPVKINEVLIADLLGLKTDLIATRTAIKAPSSS
jgi:CxxC motif-containing protein